MKIVVAGGAGFVGSHYVRTLLGGGYAACERADVVVLLGLTYGDNLADLAPVADDPEELNYAPRVDIDESLLATVEWYCDNRGWWQRSRTGRRWNRDAPALVTGLPSGPACGWRWTRHAGSAV